MITIALLALVVTLVLSNSSFLNRTLVRAELEKLYALCMHLQRTAMVTHKNQTLIFDTVRNTYTYNGHEECLCSYARFDTIKNLKGPPSAPTTAITKPITFINNKITFTPNGILQPGTIYLADSKKYCQYALTIPVSQISFLRRYRYDGKWQYLK